MAKISLRYLDSSRSDATYDVANTCKGALLRFDAHIDRFLMSLQKLRCSILFNRSRLRAILHRLMRNRVLQDACGAMVCTRGVACRRQARDTLCSRKTGFMPKQYCPSGLLHARS